MRVEGAEWVACTPRWVGRYNVCGQAIRQPSFVFDGDIPCGHEHLMAQGAPVLWADALAGQQDRLVMEAGEALALANEDGEPF